MSPSQLHAAPCAHFYDTVPESSSTPEQIRQLSKFHIFTLPKRKTRKISSLPVGATVLFFLVEKEQENFTEVRTC